MTEPLTHEEHLCPPPCDVHPHCAFCGGVMVDDGDQVMCVGCGTSAPVENRKPAEVPS
ncbi:MAG TPA: hypothetical protein VFM12_06355 [Gemmatimonadales bacterium]|nr:hypothetical protein [Gemmatimonadales bacterium]